MSSAEPAAPVSGRIFYCDPARGSVQNDGSAERPWGSVEEVIARKMIQFIGVDGKCANSNAPVKPGDTILLRSGDHGRIYIRSAYNDEFITVAAAPGESPKLSRVVIEQGRKWRLKGLTVSPSFATNYTSQRVDSIVKLGEGGGEESAELVIEDSFAYTELDSSKWTAQDWIKKAWSGIWLGRHGKRHAARNNYLLNTRFGINLCAPEVVCEGNVVANFSADGIRVTRDGQIVQQNVIKNIYVSSRDGDDNHDDGIQAFLFNRGRGTIRDVVVRENLILDREDPNQPFKADMQGIGFFDGPLVNFLVERNVVQTDHYHGVSLYDAQGCQVLSNACFCLSQESRAKPWVMLGTKQKVAKGNTVKGNIAHSFGFKADAEVQQEDNTVVTEEDFLKRKQSLLEAINAKYGPVHPVAKRPRLGE